MNKIFSVRISVPVRISYGDFLLIIEEIIFTYRPTDKIAFEKKNEGYSFHSWRVFGGKESTICNEHNYDTNISTFTGTIYGTTKNSNARAYAEKYGYNFDTLENAVKLGDVSGDSVINAGDAAYILQYAAMRGANGKDFDIRELVK